MVAIDFLQFRKNRVRQPMQYAWCAATTKNFLGTSTDKISKKEIDDLDISSLCDDIISEMSESQEGARLTLYLSSMLANGSVRLFQQQTTSLMDDCQKLMIDLLGGPDEVSQKKKKKAKVKKTIELPPKEQIDIIIPSIPKIDIGKVLDVNDARDVHLITEMDFIEIPEIPQSFGFDPNHRELTEREMEDLYREMMGLDPQTAIPDHAPQDNGFQMNDEPMIPEPVVANLLENQATPQGSSRLELEGMKTPKTKKRTRSKKSGPRSSSPSESAKTAFSPQKKRPRMSYAPDQDADICGDMMIPTEPGQEAAFPHDVLREAEAEASPVFDFRKKKRLNVSEPLQKRVADKCRAIAEMLAEPQLDGRVQLDHRLHHESAPADVPAGDAQVGLPNVSIFDVNAQVDMPNVIIFNQPPPAVIQRESNASTQSSDEPFRGFSQTSPPAVEQEMIVSTPRPGRTLPQPSAKISDRSLSALESFKEDPCKKYIKRGRKIFADRFKQVDIEPHPVNFMTKTRNEVLYPHALRHQSVLSLLSQPCTLKNKRFLPESRFWNDTLIAIHRENARVPPKKKESAQKEKKKRARDSSQERDEQNREENQNENMEIFSPEQREPSLPKNDEQLTKPRNSLVIEDTHMDIEIAPPIVHVPPADVPAIDVQNENPQEQIGNDVVQGVVPAFEQPPVDEPVFEEARTPEVDDKVEAAMSPSKRFKSRDDRELADGDPRSNRSLTVEELFEIIQSCWNKVKKKDIDRSKCVRVGFHKVIEPNHFSGVEAARYLQYCFILENKKKLYLQQKVPYDTAYLIKWQPALYEKKREKK